MPDLCHGQGIESTLELLFRYTGYGASATKRKGPSNFHSIVFMADFDMQIIGGEQFPHFISPLDHHNSAGGEEFFEADGFKIGEGGDAVGVEVVDRLGAGVDVEQDVGGGGN